MKAKQNRTKTTSKALVEFRSILCNEGVAAAAEHGRKEYKQNQRSHREMRWEWISHLCEFTLHLRTHREGLEAFMQLPFWTSKPHIPKEKNLARLAAMYMVGTTDSTGSRYEMARLHGHLVDLLLAEPVRPDRVVKFLKRAKGVKKAIKLLSASSKSPTSKDRTPAIAADAPLHHTEGYDSRKSILESVELPGVPGRSTPSSRSAVPKLDLDQQVVFEAGPFTQRLLRMPLHQRFHLECERVEDYESGFKRLQIVEVG